jgi:thiamine kinase-like enzyme
MSIDSDMEEITIQKAAVQFGKGVPDISPLGNGLIHRTYLVRFKESDPIILQCINQVSFPFPENIIKNYKLVQQYLDANSGIRIPKMVSTRQGKDFWIDVEANFWRATQYMEDSYSKDIPENAEEIYTASHCFAQFTRALAGLNPNLLNPIIPGFHDLGLRYRQLEESISGASQERLLEATHLISSLRERQRMVEFYIRFRNHPAQYPLRPMHHDCKISNILFYKNTQTVLCPVDLDTIMPGYFFSDLGDMIRTMACTRDENSTEWEQIGIKKQYYNAIMKGYLEGMGNLFTADEKAHIHQSGLLITYMQSLRFLSDFLNNDIYYKITYKEQNLHRAFNQYILLEKLEEYLADAY